MSVTTNHKMELTVKEALTLPFSNSPTITHDGLNTATNGVALSGTTNPVAVQLVAEIKVNLVGGAATLDLTALVGTNGATVNGNGLKVQHIMAQAKATNANPITLTVGAANGYLLDGAAWKWALGPGEQRLLYKANQAPTIDGTHKTIDLAGTGTQEIDLIITMG